MAGCVQRHCLRCLFARSATRESIPVFWRRQQRLKHTRTHALRQEIRALAQAAPSKTTLKESRNEQESSARNGASTSARPSTLTFQEAIVRLQEYWGLLGCALWQPHNAEVQKSALLQKSFVTYKT